jgi:hypothetical protein
MTVGSLAADSDRQLKVLNGSIYKGAMYLMQTDNIINLPTGDVNSVLRHQ